MHHIKITGSCFGFGRSFAEHQVVAVDAVPGEDTVTPEQARDLILAGRAHRHVVENDAPAPARPLSVETAEAAPAAETASSKPAAKSRRTKA